MPAGSAQVALRVFVVGCARGGTTILQSCLAAHPRVHTFPESRLFRSAEAARAPLRALGLASRGAAARLGVIYGELGLDPSMFRRRWTLRGYVADFVAAADHACLRAGRDVWLEKTPDHLHRVDVIQRWIPGVKLVHILRNGLDVVRSLVDVTRREAWGPRPWTVDECLARWMNDARLSLACRGRPGHLLLRYDDLVDRPADALRAVDGWLGLDFHPGQPQGTDLTRLASGAEPWKQGVAGGVRRTPPREDVLNPADTARVVAATAALQADIDRLPLPA